MSLAESDENRGLGDVVDLAVLEGRKKGARSENRTRVLAPGVVGRPNLRQ
jgi:hypothetical protein